MRERGTRATCYDAIALRCAAQEGETLPTEAVDSRQCVPEIIDC